jgi:hypothetical protein
LNGFIFSPDGNPPHMWFLVQLPKMSLVNIIVAKTYLMQPRAPC